MAKDSQHQKVEFELNEMDHLYGSNVHIVSSPLMLSLLAKLGHPKTHQPQINELVEMLYCVGIFKGDLEIIICGLCKASIGIIYRGFLGLHFSLV